MSNRTNGIDVVHFFVAIKPDLFMPRAECEARMDTLVERIKACPRAEGSDEILMPGEPESRATAKDRHPADRRVVAAVRDEATKSGVSAPSSLK